MSSDTPSIDVLLATWQGAKWLPVQLESLFAQTDQDFRVLARDDGSQDGTRELLQQWRVRYPGRIEVMPDDGRRLGACGNFSSLLAVSTAPWVMFCDQDDRWHADKIAVSRKTLAVLEAVHGADKPLLVHGDAALVDERLQSLDLSLSCALKFHLDDASYLRRELVQNVATGCTMLFNRPLVEACLPVPAAAIMHDWWVALVAAAIGKVTTMPGIHLDYRQHGGNAIGAGGMRLDRLLARFAIHGAVRMRFARAGGQAAALDERCGSKMTDSDRRLCRIMVGLASRGWIERRVAVARNRLWLAGSLRNLGLMVGL